jgi:flagellar biosynthesis GTPase FlhF
VTWGAAAALVVPLLGTALAAYLGYRQAVRVAERRAKADEAAAELAAHRDDRSANLAELKEVNRSLNAEIDRVRSDAAEDRAEHREEMEQVRAELRWMRRDRADQIRRDQARADFDRELMAWINEWLPRARDLGLEVPDPPRPPELPRLIDPDLLGDHP